MIKLVTQDGEHDSAAACLAMVLGLRTATDVYHWLGYNPDEMTPRGVDYVEVINILHNSGRRPTYLHTKEAMACAWKVPTGMLRQRHNLPTEQELRSKLNGMLSGAAIVGVLSQNIIGAVHYVVCHKGEVFDPSTKKRYVGSAYSLPVQFAIFIEEPL